MVMYLKYLFETKQIICVHNKAAKPKINFRLCCIYNQKVQVSDTTMLNSSTEACNKKILMRNAATAACVTI